MAATGTPTPNLGLRRAQGTDPASVDDINYNSELLDTKLGAVGATSVQGQIDALSASTAQTFGNVQDGLAIVSNGNTHVAIPAGYWVYVKGHGTLSEGLYKNTSGATIAANATLSTSNLTADPDGGLNSVYSALNSKINTQSVTSSVHVSSTKGTISSLAARRTGNVVSLAFVLTLNASVTAGTALGCTATFDDNSLKPVFRHPGSASIRQVSAVNIDVTSSGANLNAVTNSDLASGNATWLTFIYICNG